MTKPFLKWAGGKRQLLGEIKQRFPTEFGTYHEPFLGGGAVFFSGEFEHAMISDSNAELMRTYKTVRNQCKKVIASLTKLPNSEELFYSLRSADPSKMSDVEAAARFIYLNRTCYSGLHRVNKKGQFNVPFGKYNNPTICDTKRLHKASKALKKATLRCCSVFDIGTVVSRGDFVYMDPPYYPVQMGSFTTYTAEGFTRCAQGDLSQLAWYLCSMGVNVLISNSDTPYIRSLYRDFRIERVYARRSINSDVANRGKVTELLISSY